MAYFEQENDSLERQRIQQRTNYDLEMIREMGFCKGIENYSRHFSKTAAGDPPPCLIDYFPKDFLLDCRRIASNASSAPRHVQWRPRAQAVALVEFGFRLPSAYDNRPLKFEETYDRIHQVVYVSATPGHLGSDEV